MYTNVPTVIYGAVNMSKVILPTVVNYFTTGGESNTSICAYKPNFYDKSTDLLAKRGHIMSIYMKILHRWGILLPVGNFHKFWH
jgi:hypothetical protein